MIRFALFESPKTVSEFCKWRIRVSAVHQFILCCTRNFVWRRYLNRTFDSESQIVWSRNPILQRVSFILQFSTYLLMNKECRVLIVLAGYLLLYNWRSQDWSIVDARITSIVRYLVQWRWQAGNESKEMTCPSGWTKTVSSLASHSQRWSPHKYSCNYVNTM